MNDTSVRLRKTKKCGTASGQQTTLQTMTLCPYSVTSIFLNRFKIKYFHGMRPISMLVTQCSTSTDKTGQE